MMSLRFRLFALVAGLTLVVWAGAAGWTAVSTRTQLERVLDRRLVEAARMVAALDVPANGSARPLPVPTYTHQLSCQIWSLGGDLIGQSAGAPASPLAGGRAGFSDRRIGDRVWRVYTHVDATRGIRVMVGDNVDIRRRLVRDLLLGLLLPAAIGLIVLGILLWLGVTRGLVPLGKVARAIETRTPDTLAPLTVEPVPAELQPLVTAMNGLLAQLDAARQAERDFVTNAAHELQTPLAGLKTQAEVARRASDPAMRDHALERLATAVDRTSRLVRQLLELARQQGRTGDREGGFTRLGNALEDAQRDLGPTADLNRRTIETDCHWRNVGIPLEREALRLAIGNLVTNAINHGLGSNVRIVCSLEEWLEVRVIDEGPGIPDDDIARVRRRFERGRGARSTGAGLGLSIVEAAIAPAGGVLELRNGEDGFAAVLRFPRDCLRMAPVEDGAVDPEWVD